MTSVEDLMTDDESSAEAPEEINMAVGKDRALEKRKEESTNEILIKRKSKQRKQDIEKRNIAQKKSKNKTIIEQVGAPRDRKSKKADRTKTLATLETPATDYEFIPIDKKVINRHIYGSSNNRRLPFIDFKTQSLLKNPRRERNEDLLGKLEKKKYIQTH